MGRDEHEMLVEYSEMTAFNFNSEEYNQIRKDFLECKKAARGFEWLVDKFVSKFRPSEA